MYVATGHPLPIPSHFVSAEINCSGIQISHGIYTTVSFSIHNAQGSNARVPGEKDGYVNRYECVWMNIIQIDNIIILLRT